MRKKTKKTKSTSLPRTKDTLYAFSNVTNVHLKGGQFFK